MLSNIDFHFVDMNKEVVQTFTSVFSDCPNITVRRGNILSQKADCIVSPANSFACMDGGVDKAINYTLNYISKEVKEWIDNVYFGEQPVGTCLLIPIREENYNGYRFLAHTPTMRVPKDVSNSENAYCAFRALLTRLVHHNRSKKNENQQIKSVVLTSFCAGAGMMDKLVAAKQMRLAYDLIQNPIKANWENANKIEKKLMTLC